MRVLKSKFVSQLIFAKNVLAGFVKEGGMYRASALAYTTLLAIVPLMLVSVSVVKPFPVFAKWGESVQNFVFSNFVPASGEVVQTYLNSFVSKANQLSIIGLAVLLVTAVLLLFNIEQAFNTIWRIKKRRHGVIAFLLYWALLTLSPLLLGLSFALSHYLMTLPVIDKIVTSLNLSKELLRIFPAMIAVFAFTILFVAIPNCKVPFKNGLISAIFTATIFEVAKYGFSKYLSMFHTYEILYGALAAIPLFLLWIYFSWVMILFGAQLSFSLSHPEVYKGQ